MKVDLLDESVVGRRIRVISAAVGEAERLGFVDDSERLPGHEGVAEAFVPMRGYMHAQLRVRWDSEELGLSLAGEDEVEILDAG